MSVSFREGIRHATLKARASHSRSESRQGQRGENLYIIYEGMARVLVSKRVFRKNEEVAVLRNGDLFGEMSLILEQPCNATVVASGPVKVFVGKKGVFEYLCRESETFAATLEKLIQERGTENEVEEIVSEEEDGESSLLDNITYTSRLVRNVSITKEDGSSLAQPPVTTIEPMGPKSLD